MFAMRSETDLESIYTAQSKSRRVSIVEPKEQDRPRVQCRMQMRIEEWICQSKQSKVSLHVPNRAQQKTKKRKNAGSNTAFNAKYPGHGESAKR